MGVSGLFAFSPAVADIVNVTTSSTLFSGDGFEGLGSNVSHAGYPDTSGDYNPTGGSPGSWTITEASPYDVQVTDVSNAAYYGTNYLRVMRPDSGTVEAKQGFATQSTTNDHIRLTEMVYIPSTPTSNPFQLYGVGSDGSTRRMNILTNYGGYSVGSYYSGAVHDTGLTFSSGVWQNWQVDYNVGAPTCTLTVGTQSATVTISSSGDLAAFAFSKNPDATYGFALDDQQASTPEPSSIVLLVSAMFSLLCYAWRRRR